MRHVVVPLGLFVALLTGPAAGADGPLAPFPKGYLTHGELGERLRQVAARYPGRVEVRTLAASRGGRDVWVVSLGNPPQGQDRPAALVVAGLEADSLVGGQVALGMIERLAAAPADAGWLAKGRVHIVPRLDVDGAERTLAAAAPPVRGNARQLDRDRDGRVAEDSPEDLNGDGAITAMWARDRRASLVPEADDPRRLRAADPAKGEAGRYSIYVEGVDSDGDGGLNEDPAAGVRLDRNWPQRPPEFQPDAGPFPISEPETRGLIEFVRAHPEIAAVWTFGLHDTLRDEPKKPGSTLDDADLPLVKGLSALYREELDRVPKDRPLVPTGAKPTLPALDEAAAPAEAPSRFLELPDPNGALDGSMSEWAYGQWGALGIASRVWDGPRWADPAEGEPKPPAEGEARWLFWNDRVLGGAGFVPPSPFDHPTLGRVLLGGWRTGVKLNPPAESVGPLAEAHGKFLEALLDRLPRLTLATASARPLGGGLFEVEALVRNEGTLPTALAQGVKTRRANPVLVRLGPEAVRVVGGRRLERVETLAGSGGNRTFRWIVAVPDGVDRLTIEASCPRAGRASREVTLR
jgi:hypothetical protein